VAQPAALARKTKPVKEFLLRTGSGGAEGSRTPDLSIANAALSQLSYGPDPDPAANAGPKSAHNLLPPRANVKHSLCGPHVHPRCGESGWKFSTLLEPTQLHR
jgi:hypothetical protein